ncbi:MAG: squalene/phytoene synthase family protein [Pyrinomonadaceae bacterium]|nr:squalene/phytoene synthase family protein [Pyrinomonadaceae bacterium]MCX7640880.1 squalene/phytoene synthase family protein [Pyrinomonadaceae bacterium]MDW8304684.1 squalene/phytoene synthase family protein [Acidobacteriota bacterium]
MSLELKKAYRYCKAITKKHAKSFYFASKFLPKQKRKSIYVLYAFCRHVDDEIDKAKIENESHAIEEVKKWQESLEKLYNDGFPSGSNDRINLVLLAWSDVLRSYKIPLSLPIELIKGVLMDTHVKRYETFDTLYVYCYRVASTVGLMSCEIFGYQNPSALKFAEAMGIAMQITNILRDVGEDAKMQRIYIPLEDLKNFGVSEEQIIEGKKDDNFIRLMKFQIDRARKFYKEAEQGIPILEPDTRFTVFLASRIYAKILDEIEKQDYDVFNRRAHTTTAQKLLSLPSLWLEFENFKRLD